MAEAGSKTCPICNEKKSADKLCCEICIKNYKEEKMNHMAHEWRMNFPSLGTWVSDRVKDKLGLC